MLKNQLRIIAGQWRGRKLTFPDIKALRPTPDRVRETLFNWLAPNIQGARCLDLFAGSGALGFEALSRGAAGVVLIENNPLAYNQLIANKQLLKCQNAEILKIDAKMYLEQAKHPFDIIFLDPPFHQNLIPIFCNLLENSQPLKQHSLIYIESEIPLKSLKLPNHWEIIKQSQAGQVSYGLAMVNDPPFEKGGLWHRRHSRENGNLVHSSFRSRLSPGPE